MMVDVALSLQREKRVSAHDAIFQGQLVEVPSNHDDNNVRPAWSHPLGDQ
jgi:hypothetical protein